MPISGLDFYDVMGDQAPAPNGYQAQEIMGPIQGAGGAANREMLTGAPGLFVQGGAGIPEGQLTVNGVVENETPVNQGTPWWIKAYDEYKAQRQAEDDAYRMLQRIQSDMPAGAGAQSGQKAMQLQAKLMYDADLRNGVSPQEALAKHAVGLFGQTAPRAAVAAVRAGVPRTITPYEEKRLSLSERTFEESKKRHKDTMELAKVKQTDSADIAKEKSRQQAVIKLGEQASKQKEADPRMQRREPERWKKLTDREEAGAIILEQIAGGGSIPPGQAAPAAPAQSAGVRFRDKKSGKTGIWRGPVASLTTDNYEILK